MKDMKKIINCKFILIIGYLFSIILMLYVKHSEYQIGAILFYNNLILLPLFVFLIGCVFVLINSYNKIIVKSPYLNTICILYLSINLIILHNLWIIKYGSFADVDWWIHLLNIENIIKYSTIDLQKSFYPALHLMVSEYSLVTNINPQSSYIHLSFILTFFYGLICSLLVENIIKNRNVPIGLVFLIISINPIVLCKTFLVPWYFNCIYISLYLYLVIRNSIRPSSGNIILLTICIVSLTITHVIASVFIIVSFFVMYYLAQSIEFFSKVKIIGKSNATWNHIILFTVVLLAWLFITTGFGKNQFFQVAQQIPSILFEPATAQQKMVTNKPLLQLLLTRVNFVSNTIFIAISLFILSINSYKKQYINRSNIIFSSYVVAGFILFILFQVILGKTNFSGTQIRFFYFASIAFLPLISYSCSQLLKYTNTQLLSLMLLIIFLFSVLTIYPDEDPISITESTCKGLDWGNYKVISENNTVITGADFLCQYIIYKIGSRIYPSITGSTNGLLLFLGYDYHKYKHRQNDEKFSINPNDKVYLYQYPLMNKYISYSKIDSKIISLNDTEVQNKKVNKIYNSVGFIIYKLDESEVKRLADLSLIV